MNGDALHPKVACPDDEVWVRCRVPKADICYLRYTLEAYEGLCVPTTLPGKGGVVQLLTSRALRAQLEEVLAALAGETGLQILEWGEGNPEKAVEMAQEAQR